MCCPNKNSQLPVGHHVLKNVCNGSFQILYIMFEQKYSNNTCCQTFLKLSKADV